MKTLSLIFLLLSLIFCRAFEENPSSPSGSFLKIAYPSDPVSMDPLFSTDLTTEKIIPLLHSTLFRLDEYGTPKPFLASSHTWNPNAQRLEIALPDSISAETVRTSLSRLLTTPGPRRDNYKGIQRIDSSPGRIDLYISPESSPGDILNALCLAPASIQGNTGPYILREWKKGNSILLEKNRALVHPKIDPIDYPEFIEILIIPQSTSGLFLFTKGQLDSMKLSDFLLSNHIISDKNIIGKKGRSVQYVAINNTNPCFDIHFRRAVNLAIDRDKIISTILENNAEITTASIPRSKLRAPDHYLSEVYDKNLAEEELKKSKCYPNILNQEIDFRMRADDENRSKGRAVVEYLRAIGLRVTIRGMEKAPLYKENGMKKGDLTFLTWYADYPSPFAFIDPVFHSNKQGNGGNRAFYSNPNMDRFIQDKNLDEALKVLIEEKPWIFLWSIHENYLVSEKLLQYPRIQEYL